MASHLGKRVREVMPDGTEAVEAVSHWEVKRRVLSVCPHFHLTSPACTDWALGGEFGFCRAGGWAFSFCGREIQAGWPGCGGVKAHSSHLSPVFQAC